MMPPRRRKSKQLPDALQAEVDAAMRSAKKAARTYRGIVYDSKWEARAAASYDDLVSQGILTRWERQVTFLFVIMPDQGLHVIESREARAYRHCRFVMSGSRKMRYSLDFRLFYADGRTEIVECKGYPREDWKVKHAFWEAVYLPAHPDVTFRLLGQETFGSSR